MRWMLAAAAVLAFAPGIAVAGPAKLDKNVITFVMFERLAPDPAELEQRTLAPGAVFAVQKLRAGKSAVSTEELKIGSGIMVWDMALPTGTRLLSAAGENGREFFCGDVQVGKAEAILNGKARKQWLCFEDVDKDGVFDQGGYTEINKGAALPSFSETPAFYPAKFAYKMDEADQTAAYEIGIEYKGTNNLADALAFELKVRAAGQTEWSDLLSGGVQGGFASLSSKQLPKTLSLDGRSITVLARDGEAITAKVEQFKSGATSFRIMRY